MRPQLAAYFDAAMEPGRDDREDGGHPAAEGPATVTPQWSPVVMTGRTRIRRIASRGVRVGPQWSPVVMTGRTGRWAVASVRGSARRNGARS